MKTTRQAAGSNRADDHTEDITMSDMKKLNDEALTNVTGGKTRYVQNGAGANVRSGPARVNPVIHIFCF